MQPPIYTSAPGTNRLKPIISSPNSRRTSTTINQRKPLNPNSPETCDPKMGPTKFAKEKKASEMPCIVPCRLLGKWLVYKALAGVRIKGAGAAARINQGKTKSQKPPAQNVKRLGITSSCFRKSKHENKKAGRRLFIRYVQSRLSRACFDPQRKGPVAKFRTHAKPALRL